MGEKFRGPTVHRAHVFKHNKTLTETGCNDFIPATMRGFRKLVCLSSGTYEKTVCCGRKT